MMAPMKDWIFKVVPVMSSAMSTPQITAGIVERTTKPSRSDWKFADSNKKITRTARARPSPRFASVRRMGATWPRTFTVTPRGGLPARFTAVSTWAAARPRSSLPTFAVRVTIRSPLNRSYSPTSVPYATCATSPIKGRDAPSGIAGMF